MGQCADGDTCISELIGALKSNAFVASIHPFHYFGWLREIPCAAECFVVRAVIRILKPSLSSRPLCGCLPNSAGVGAFMHCSCGRALLCNAPIFVLMIAR